MQEIKLNYKKIIKISIVILIAWSGLKLIISHIYFNPTISEPIGVYLTYGAIDYHRGDRVLICVTDEGRALVLHHLGLPYVDDTCTHKLPYLLKGIVAVAGDRVVIDQRGVFVNGILCPNSKAYYYYKAIYLNPQLSKNIQLKANEYLVLGDSMHSYDSRYFGIINKSAIYEKAKLVWVVKK